MAMVTGGELVVRVLEKAGVKTVFGLHGAHQQLRIDLRSGQGKQIPVGPRLGQEPLFFIRHLVSRTPAHGRQKCHFILFGEYGAGANKLLVPRK